MSFPRYEAYKDSGVEWLGEVPRHWKHARLGQLTRCGMGQTILKEMLDAEASPNAVPVYSASESITEFGFLTNPSIVLGPGDLIVGARGSIGFTRKVVEPSTCTQTTIWIRPDREAIAPEYLYWFMTGNREQLFPFDKTAIPMLTVEQVRQGNVLLPTPSEQFTIASFLDRETAKIDALVEEQRRLIELLKEKRQAVISHAVTKGLNADAPIKDSGVEWLGEVPAHWEVVRMGNLFTECVKSGNDSLPILSVSIHHGVSDREFDEDELERKVSRSEDRSKYKSVRPNDLVYNMMRAWQGGFGTVAVFGMVSPAYVVARPLREFATAFIEHQLRSPQAVEEMRRNSYGVTDFRLRLYWDAFKQIGTALPPKREQADILARIEQDTRAFDALTKAAEHAIALLQERRSALISAAVTGKIDVRGLVPSEVEAA